MAGCLRRERGLVLCGGKRPDREGGDRVRQAGGSGAGEEAEGAWVHERSETAVEVQGMREREGGALVKCTKPK